MPPHAPDIRLRRRPRRFVLVVVALVVGLLLVVGSGLGAGAQPAETRATRPVVSVVSVSGLIDPIVADFLTQSIDEAERAGAVALVWQVDLEGSVIPSDDYVRLLGRMGTAGVDIDIWIGPSGAQLTGRAALLAVPADHVGMAPGTRIGGIPASPFGVDQRGTLDASFIGGSSYAPLSQAPLDVTQAEAAGIAKLAPTIGDFIVNLPKVETKEISQNGQTRREPVTAVVFTQLPVWWSFLHGAGSPPVAYLLLAMGLALMIFELFTAGVGVAGVIGAGSFVLACYGLTVLPNHWYGIALLSGSMIAFAIDVQTGVPRAWTAVGVGAFALGSLLVYPGTDGVGLSWFTVLVGIVAMVLTFVAGMPAMVRTRFSTPTIGREWMMGEMGRAVTDVSPDGVVEIRGAQWRAYTNRATPIEQLDPVRVVGIKGLVLEVEPEEGAARDYRERPA